MSHTSKRPVISADTDVLFQNCVSFKNVVYFSIQTPLSSLLFTLSLHQACITLQILGVFLSSLDIIQSNRSLFLISLSQKPNMFASKLP